MNGVDLKAWREAERLTQGDAATALGVSRPTIARAEANPDAMLSAALELALQRMTSDEPPPDIKPEPKPAKVAKAAKPDAPIDPKRLPRAYDFSGAPAFTVGLQRLPATNEAFKASAHWDERPASPGWQRIPGCVQICIDTIPDPIPFKPKGDYGPRAILTASGAVYDYEGGHRINTAEAMHVSRSTEPFQRQPKVSKR